MKAWFLGAVQVKKNYKNSVNAYCAGWKKVILKLKPPVLLTKWSKVVKSTIWFCKHQEPLEVTPMQGRNQLKISGRKWLWLFYYLRWKRLQLAFVPNKKTNWSFRNFFENSGGKGGQYCPVAVLVQRFAHREANSPLLSGQQAQEVLDLIGQPGNQINKGP